MLKKTLFLSILSLACFPLRAVDDGTDHNPMTMQPSIMKGESNFLPTVSQNPQYQILFNLAYGYFDFCIQCQEELKYFDTHKPHHEKVLKQNEVILQINTLASLKLIEKFIQLDKGGLALDKVLKEMLSLPLIF